MIANLAQVNHVDVNTAFEQLNMNQSIRESMNDELSSICMDTTDEASVEGFRV